MFRNFLVGQVSVLLLRFAELMHAAHVASIPVGISGARPQADALLWDQNDEDDNSPSSDLNEVPCSP